MNILLLRPPRRGMWDIGLGVPPMGLAYIAASLRKNGYSVQILDAYVLGWTWKQLQTWISNRHFDVLGCTVMTPTLDIVQRALSICKPFVDSIVIGGPHPTAVKQEVFHHLPDIDAAVAHGHAVRVTMRSSVCIL